MPPLLSSEASCSYLAPSPVWKLSTTLILSSSTCMAAVHRCVQSRGEDGGDGLALITFSQTAAFIKWCNTTSVQYSNGYIRAQPWQDETLVI